MLSDKQEHRVLWKEKAYATPLRHAALGRSRIERILVKNRWRETIRFSAWKTADVMYLQPLDIPEDELVILIGDAIAAGVFSATFLDDLRGILNAR